MEPFAFVVAILGCGDAGSGCERVMIEPVRYETRSGCLAAAGNSLAQHTDLLFPVVQARCETRGMQIASR
ncbi:hypothetical protein SPAN111604_04920 [Sphingomonas antarctica]|uniref:hypothetical protein n=1 Tax=Sphingomonas antarctica TaxID=2040274 RepID=UPI0039ECA3EE